MLMIGRFFYDSFLEFYKENANLQRGEKLDILRSFSDLQIVDGDTILAEVNCCVFHFADRWFESLVDKLILVHPKYGRNMAGIFKGFDEDTYVWLKLVKEFISPRKELNKLNWRVCNKRYRGTGSGWLCE